MIAQDTSPGWHVLGAGAIGGLWAIRLAASGQAVTLLSHRTDSASTRTLHLQDGSRRQTLTLPQQRSDQASGIRRLLVATKSHVTADALTPLLPRLAPDTPVLLLQNGMGADDWLATARPDLVLLAGISTDGVFRPQPDELVLAGQGETLIGARDPRHNPVACELAALLSGAGHGVRHVEDIRRPRWNKLAMNCAINPLTALYRCRNGELLENPEALATMRQVAAEVAAVMTAEGLPTDTETLFQSACAAARSTAANLSSMHADVAAGRATEIRFLNGHVVDVASRHGLAAPVNARLLRDILALTA